MNSVRTCKQSNVYFLLIFAKNLNFALSAEFQPIAIVVRLSTMHSVKIRSQHRFLLKISFFRTFFVFFSLQLFATLMKAGSDSENVLVRALIPGPFSDTKRKGKHNTEEKQH